MRRATNEALKKAQEIEFLSTLSLRRATSEAVPRRPDAHISIHALLAESDCSFCPANSQRGHFYPRSPCGERRSVHRTIDTASRFLSTLSLRRATVPFTMPDLGKGFLSTLSLRRATMTPTLLWRRQKLFLSTLSLRRATICQERQAEFFAHFYPRSPCGERLHYDNYNLHCTEISIHALLAESDDTQLQQAITAEQFLSTLSLRRATEQSSSYSAYLEISIHALLAESDNINSSVTTADKISIHALLAESDVCITITIICIALFLSTLSLRRATCGCYARCRYWGYFYPRSPCGERLFLLRKITITVDISIHALLAESDVISVILII